MAKSPFRASLRRDWRERDVRVVLTALIIAVATVATITLFADQLQRTLTLSASSFLAADRQLISENGQPVPAEWLAEAELRGLATAKMVRFPTMMFGDGNFQLVSVKAVSAGYPLRGQIEIQTTPDSAREMRARGPEPGTVWVGPRLLQLLKVSVGDPVEVGELELRVSGLLIREPDGGFSLSGLAPRVMMHADDVAATGVVQQGSRVAHVALFAGDEGVLTRFGRWLQPKLLPSQDWVSIHDGETLSASLEKAERFLLLGGSIAVLLAAVAVAVASRQYALSQRDSVALLKTLGLTGKAAGRLYVWRLLSWGVAGALAGILVALPLYAALAGLLASVLESEFALQVEPRALLPALVTALIAMFAFAWPPIRRLQTVPAMRVLRSEPGESRLAVIPDIAIAVGAMVVLLWLYARDVTLVVALLAGLALLLATLAVLGWLMVLALKGVIGGGSSWRLALVALYRHRRASLSQISVFALTVMLACTLLLIRTSLLSDWQAQLPEDAPNHFLINISPQAVAEVKDFWGERGHGINAVYPMVRGRLTELNGQPVRQVVSKDERVEALNRELNLTWTDRMPADNQLLAGRWFEPGETRGVSVEAELAQRLGISLGDQLGFTIGSETITEPVTSIRSVQWDNMRPNFYMIFPPQGALDTMPATWMTSFYLPETAKQELNGFSRAFPTVSVLEVDHIIARIQSIVAQVTQAIEAILWLILAAALVVMAAVVSATLQDRQREGALLRTLGARQTLLVRSTMAEFALLGFFAGLLGVAGSEAAVWGLQYRVFEAPFRMHWGVILPIPLVSALILALFGRWQLKPVLRVSPMLLLRRLE
ncbi:ABC transporter permease [Marinobacter sp. X15-166B]|uniref:ABC transporter permease n=1 Tax=Marinobacter sp. X15-166B TaxID=1897620 RepID=UPI00085C521D|nr:FtsX-like permease family protein [Marinobacter sp. X15-166B]OEY67304.1 ABC transporter ATP-binding protein [Marinobacter sp. X15-166B]